MRTTEKRIAIEFCREKKQVFIGAGRGNTLGYSLIAIASAMEEINQKKCLELYLCRLDLLKLYKMKNRYEEALSYFFKKEFSQDLHYRGQLREALHTENWKVV